MSDVECLIVWYLFMYIEMSCLFLLFHKPFGFRSVKKLSLTISVISS